LACGHSAVEFGPGAADRSKLAYWQTNRERAQRKRKSRTGPKPTAAKLPFEYSRGDCSLDARPRGLEADKPSEQDERRDYQRPAQTERADGVKGGAEAYPYFRGKDFDLQDRGNSEVIQGQDESQDCCLGEAGSRQGKE